MRKMLFTLSAMTCAILAEATPAADTTTVPTLGEITVTGTREERPLAETPAAIGVIKRKQLKELSPTHPSQIMGQVPGVWVNTTGGEGHMTAIRQPLTTSPVYLFLEDGIPTRSTGFFNHNALYEINVPMAEGIEVTKGPGTALYGSDAIGGIINVLTRPAPAKPEAEISLEGGSYGWRRLLATGGNTVGDNGWRTDLNLTGTDGWRDATNYDRQSGTLRWDRVFGGDALLKTIATFSNIDQQTAGTSTLREADYHDNPTLNYTPISLRKVKAFRLSSAYEKEIGNTLISITPYVRYNEMDLLPNWALTFDPTISNVQNKSIGLVAKYRYDFVPLRTRVIAGIDLDYSPGSRFEQSINTTRNGRTFTAYSVGQTLYDYDATFRGISPYLHTELSPTERLRLTAGVRYDHLGYKYDNRLPDSDIVIRPANIPFNITYRHPSDRTVSFDRLSPKLGATYGFAPDTNVFVSYNQAFRAPSEGQLFRPGTALNTVDLKPVVADSYEIGLRSKLAEAANIEVSVYRMTKQDDILSYRDPVTGATQAVNAGKTLHRGVEMKIGADLWQQLRFDSSVSYAKHSYQEWAVSGTADYSGNEIETAPRLIANTRLSYAPPLLKGGRLTMEWVKLGSYWMDAANTQKYDGHDLLNLRAYYPVRTQWELFGSITNLADTRYAETTSYTTTRGRELAPGMPRTFYAGVRYNWNK